MKKLILIVALVVGFADTAFAESWLCIPEVGIYMDESPPFKHGEAETDAKYLLKLNPESSKYEFGVFGGSEQAYTCQESTRTINCFLQFDGVGRADFIEFQLSKNSKSFHFIDQENNYDEEMTLKEGDMKTQYVHWAGKCDQI